MASLSAAGPATNSNPSGNPILEAPSALASTPRETAGIETSQTVHPEDIGIGTLFTAVRDAVIVTNATTGRVVLWNPAAEQIFGYPAGEAVGMQVRALVPEWRRDEVLAHLREYAATGRSQLTEVTAPSESVVVRKDGQEIVVESTVAPLDPKDHPELVGRFLLSISRDITERKRKEEAFRRAAVAQALLLESARAILWRGDAQPFQFSYVSPEAEKLLGYPRERWLEEPAFWKDHIHDDDREWAVQHRTESTNALRNHEHEYRMVAADGRVVWLRDIVAVVPDEDRPKELIGVMVDISREREIHQELERRTNELQRSNAELEQFAYVASHDLQEPLRTVVSYLQLIEEDYRNTLGAEGKEFLDYAVDGAKRMQTLINDLLVYSRVERRGRPFEPVSLEAVLHEVLSDLRTGIVEAGAQITHDTLPMVSADVMQLAQLLQNILSNALKFRDREPPRIHLSAEREGPMWRIAVRDNGIGIAPEYQDLIFAIFQRLHVRDEFPGTGIGLAVCAKIVERHGGRIWVESAVGKGSTFYFTLPAVEEQSDSQGEPAA
jgi:PAS domain S-box-containing protein